MSDVREMMTSWHGSGKPHLLAWSDRKKDLIKGAARGTSESIDEPKRGPSCGEEA